MKKKIITILATICLLLPVAALATTQSSPNYTIDGDRIVSGGGAGTDVSGMSNSGIAIGQGVFIPAAGISSPSYAAKASALASPQPGGIHSGDINGDGIVNIVDAVLALKSGIGIVVLSPQESVRGDVGPLVNNVPVGNGRIDIEDTLLILRKAVGMSW
jgi:hypothetical protein